MLLDFPQLAVGLNSSRSDHPCVSWKIPPRLGLGLTTALFLLFSTFPIVLVENRLSNPFTIVKAPSFRICSSIDIHE